MVQLGPAYDAAVRLAAIERRLSRLESNPIGQAFSATQSDGSIGLQIGQDAATGATAMVFRQGPATARDPNTDQHPQFVYLGQLYADGVLEDAGGIFSRPTGAESMVVGNRGTQILDPGSHVVFSTDEYGSAPSQIGLNTPWIPLGQPVTSGPTTGGWPNTTSTSMASVAFLTFPAQHSHITWYGATYLASGTANVQMTVNNGAAGAVQTVGSGFTNLSETFSLGTWSWQQVCQFAVNAEVTSGADPIYVSVQGVWGCGSGF